MPGKRQNGKRQHLGLSSKAAVRGSNQNASASERRNHGAVRHRPEAARSSAAELVQGSWCNAVWDPKSPRICSVPIRPDQILFSE